MAQIKGKKEKKERNEKRKEAIIHPSPSQRRKRSFHTGGDCERPYATYSPGKELLLTSQIKNPCSRSSRRGDHLHGRERATIGLAVF
ncbi:hypothetical protein TRV_00980 [Trichophyton verrucosum HKI 0517]|uniref:Uncharacterized protein n=1 Tax=Trichophyton verrucosum (strain HKI 0517) TaxID=663202 RepID=D4D1N8_TRIVH|nr:uncharacterized protein TRV_00980 [Trichophyton verrucosum HKI 0517]EFE44205.1 hypothetical protein TRV_00980 [Trichophyton verrucosum HKI 0517]